MVSPTVKNNSRLSLNFMQATPNHTLVPVESLTSSPTSSTGSASVLEWNSNSDGELLELSPPATLTAPLTPPISSPIQFSPPLAENSRPNHSTSDLDDPFLSQWETPTDTWTPLFDGLMPPAPISLDTVAPTVVDEAAADEQQSQEAAILKLCSDIEHSFWVQPSSIFGVRKPLVNEDKEEEGTPTSPPSADTSMASTVIRPQSSDLPSTSIAASTAPATRSPPVSSSLFNTPVVMPPEPLIPSTSLSREENVPETISIAEYFQRKALSAEEAVPRATRTPVETPPRPESAHSDLSYFTQTQSPVLNSPLVTTINHHYENNSGPEVENDFSYFAQPRSPAPSSPDFTSTTTNNNNNNEAEHILEPPQTSTQRPVISLGDSWPSWNAVPTFSPAETAQSFTQQSTDNLLTRSPNFGSPLIGQYSGLSWSDAPGLFGPRSPMSSPPQSEQEIHSPLAAEFPLASAESPSPYSSRSNSPGEPVPQAESILYPSGGGFHRNKVSSPEFPRRTTYPPFMPPSFEFPRRDLDLDLPRVHPLLNPTPPRPPQPEANNSITSSSGTHPMILPTPSPVENRRPQDLSDTPIPNIPTWLVNSVKSAQDSRRTFVSRPRPPLPPLPRAEHTPQLALRTDGITPGPRNDYYATAFPSNWSAPPLPPPPLSPWPRAPSPLSTDSHPSPRSTNEPLSYPNFSSAHRVEQAPPVNNSYMTPNERMSHFFNAPHPYMPSNRSVRDLPNPRPYWYVPPRPQYTGSTLPKDRTVPPPAPPTWDPPQRRLRFAPLPPTPNYRPGPPPLAPPYPSGPPSFSPYNYLYQTPAPVIPPVPAPAPPPPSLLGPNSYPSSKKYWFTDATVVFRVENCLYRVHRHFFELHSTHIRQMLTTYWYSPMNHLFLPNVKKVEFERLLSIFYPSDLTKPDITTVAGWTSILDLSNKWDMAQLEALAIQKLGPLTTAVEKIAIAKKHGMTNHEWLIPAYTELCARRAPLSLDEAEELDLATIIKIWEVQHAILDLRCNCCEEKIIELVKEKFGFVDDLPFVPPSW